MYVHGIVNLLKNQLDVSLNCREVCNALEIPESDRDSIYGQRLTLTHYDIWWEIIIAWIQCKGKKFATKHRLSVILRGEGWADAAGRSLNEENVQKQNLYSQRNFLKKILIRCSRSLQKTKHCQAWL